MSEQRTNEERVCRYCGMVLLPHEDSEECGMKPEQDPPTEKPEVIALLQCGIDDANDCDKDRVMYVAPDWMRHTCTLALDEIERLRAALEKIAIWIEPEMTSGHYEGYLQEIARAALAPDGASEPRE